MKKQFAVATVVIMVMSVLMAMPVMSGDEHATLGDENVTNITNVNGTNETVVEETADKEPMSGSGNANVTATSSITCNSCEDCSNKLNGKYDTVKLTKDLINVKGSCITFGANNVVFDGNGHKIDGDDVGEFDSGIMMSSKSGNTIKNCEITDFESGITLYGSSKNKIYDNEVCSNYYDGIWISTNSDSNNIHDNRIEDNGKYGVYFSSDSNNNIFSKNVVCSNPIDIHDDDKNSGDDNTCDTAHNWNDDGTNGCTYSCPAEKPDLMITDIQCDRENHRIGYKIKNVGDATAPKGHYTTLFVDGAYKIKEQVDVDLAPGASSQRYFDYYSWQCTPPQDNVKVCADYGDFVDESNEKNNCREETCECVVEALSDLIVSIKGPERVMAGEDIDIEVTARNIGSATAPGYLDVEYWKAYHVDLILSSDSDIPLKSAVLPAYPEDFVEDMLLKGGRISWTESIPPKGYVTYTLRTHIPKRTSPGIYCLGAVVDPAKAVNELSEDNNTYCHKINILPPEMAPTKPPAGVDFWVMPYAVGGTPLYNINDSGLTDYTDWMSDINMTNAPFGGRLGFRHGYHNSIPTDGIKYYRWLYKHEGETEWHEFMEPVGVHYVKEIPGELPTFPLYILGPKDINVTHLYEFKPNEAPPCNGCITYWADAWFGDIYSGFLNSEAIPDGRYEIKLEVYDRDGSQVIPSNGKFRFIVPIGVAADGTVLTREASRAEIDNGGFVFTLHIDNRKCGSIIDAPMVDTTSVADECGFIRYKPTETTVHIAFHTTHPDNFAMFRFRIVRGAVSVSSASDEVATLSAGVYSGDGNGNFEHNFSRGELLGNCSEAAFSENLYVYAKATTGWRHRITKLDALAVRAFALSPYRELPKKPDLVITKVWHEYTGPRFLENTTIYYDIKNQGEGTAGASKTYMNWYPGDALVSTDDVPPLSAGQTRTESFAPYTFSETGFDINICADGDHIIAETDETNNCKRYYTLG